jgi:hypothetical protein
MQLIEALLKALGIVQLGAPGLLMLMFHPVLLTIVTLIVLRRLLKRTGFAKSLLKLLICSTRIQAAPVRHNIVVSSRGCR